MISVNTRTVNAPADRVWQLVGPEFVDVAKWMAAIPRSEAIEGTPLKGAPAKGRYSYLMPKFNGLYQEEVLTDYDPQARSLSVHVTLHKTPKIAPIRGYTSTVSIKEIDAQSCELTWTGAAKAKWFARPLQNALTKSMHPGFLRSVEEIKHICETGTPHPRKLEKIAELQS